MFLWHFQTNMQNWIFRHTAGYLNYMCPCIILCWVCQMPTNPLCWLVIYQGVGAGSHPWLLSTNQELKGCVWSYTIFFNVSFDSLSRHFHVLSWRVPQHFQCCPYFPVHLQSLSVHVQVSSKGPPPIFFVPPLSLCIYSTTSLNRSSRLTVAQVT